MPLENNDIAAAVYGYQMQLRGVNLTQQSGSKAQHQGVTSGPEQKHSRHVGREKQCRQYRRAAG